MSLLDAAAKAALSDASAGLCGPLGELRRALDERPLFAKMLELYKVMICAGEYRDLRRGQPALPLFMLDNVNFSSAVVEDPLPLSELLSLFEIEPGYATITGDCEIGAILRELEHSRAVRYAATCGLRRTAAGLRQVIDGMVGMATAGATGAAHAVLQAALHRDLSGGAPRGGGRRALVFNTPCYGLPEGFARQHGLVPVPVPGTPEDGFLPAVTAIAAAVTPETLACFLTFPSNPSLACWRSRDLPALGRLVERCQELDVVLVADTVFQDMAWGDEPAPEIFALARRPHLLAKIGSPSKDRPFACGYRAGHLLADAALEPWLHQAEALAKNSSGTLNLLWLAVDCLLRRALLAGELRREDCALLAGRYLCGYGAPELTADQIYDRLSTTRLFERYRERVAAFKRTIWSQLGAVHAWLERSACFEPLPLPSFGNLLMVRVRPPYDLGEEMTFFLEALLATNVASTVGGCFGVAADQGVWFRVAVGGAATAEVLAALDRLQTFLIARVAAPAPVTPAPRPGVPAVDGLPAPRVGPAPPALPASPDDGEGAAADMADPASYASTCDLVGLEPGADRLRLTWQDGGGADFHYLWLRDNCACRQCRHPQALERTFDVLQTPLDVRPEEVVLLPGGVLRLVWPEAGGHVSLFAAGWLRAHRCAAAEAPAARRLWGRELTGSLPALAHSALQGGGAAVDAWCRQLMELGVAVVRGVPLLPGEVARAASRLGFVWQHSFGEVFDVRVTADTDSSAYTALGLPPHTDLPSRAQPPGFQFLHCLANDVVGGDFLIVDGFKIAAALRDGEPELYSLLATVPVEFRFVSRQVDFRHQATILEHDATGALRAVRFNSFLQAPLRLPAELTLPFYRAYRRFLTLASAAEYQVRMRFAPGDLVSFDNWRILHAREPYAADSGQRHLQGCYMDRDELYSRLRVEARGGHGPGHALGTTRAAAGSAGGERPDAPPWRAEPLPR